MIYLSAGEAWTDEMMFTLQDGALVSPRGMRTREMMFREYTIIDPLTFNYHGITGRQMKHAIGLLEGLSLVGQCSVPEMFTSRVRKFGEFTDAGIFYGAYGTRVHGQLEDLVTRLRGDPDTRQGVLTIFDGGRDLAASKKDIPCTVSIQFMPRGGRLHMKVNMRSNDLWLGTPYDLQQFAILQATLAQVLGLDVGKYVHSSGSSHLYERDWTASQEVRYVHPDGRGFELPLWAEPDAMSAAKLGNIVSRARQLLLNAEGFKPLTPFEQWARWNLII